MPTPKAEIDIEEALVRRLLTGQHPDLASGHLSHLADGWDNSNWRVTMPEATLAGGADGGPTSWTVRLPRHAQAARLIRSEHLWLNRLTEALPVEVPLVERVGEPTDDYPWPWSVCRWVEGEILGSATLLREDVDRLADLLARLHRPAPADAPSNPYRGVPLGARRDAFETNLAAAADRGLVDAHRAKRARDLFEAGASKTWQQAPVWLHGDLHPRNVLVRQGRLAGLLDWGDLTSGDPASDLACSRLLIDAADHELFWDRYRRLCTHSARDDSFTTLVQRADAWALYFGVLVLEAGTPDDPTFAAVGRRVLADLLP